MQSDSGLRPGETSQQESHTKTTDPLPVSDCPSAHQVAPPFPPDHLCCCHIHLHLLPPPLICSIRISCLLVYSFLFHFFTIYLALHHLQGSFIKKTCKCKAPLLLLTPVEGEWEGRPGPLGAAPPLIPCSPGRPHARLFYGHALRSLRCSGIPFLPMKLLLRISPSATKLPPRILEHVIQTS